ncbi:MAG: DUF1566 domain-containing protein, partial [Alistipes sp.]|nr:DUF1566 domain-containing protein [Alistipes sp.]
TITDILEGEHTLRIQYNGNQNVQKITVNRNNIYFRCNVNTAAARPQYVIFALEPKNAIVTIDGATYMPDSEGYVQLLLLNGTHNYSVKAQGYHEESGTFTVSGAKVEREIMLRPVETNATTTTTTTSTSTSWSSSSTLGRTYKVGDYYNENGKQGVVFWVDSSGKHGKIVSLTESPSKLLWSSDSNERKRLIGADDKYNGANNMRKVKQIYGWESKYPAFKWCADLGEGWYLPAIEELKIFALNASVHDAVNQTLASKGKKLANKGDHYYYWSSTEYNYQHSTGEFRAWYIHLNLGSAISNLKCGNSYARAVSAF